MFNQPQRRGRRSLMLMTALSTGMAALTGQAASAAEQAQTAQAAPAAIDEIVVTGSRIVRDGFEAPTPVTVLSAEELNRTAAVNLIDAVIKLPTLQQSYNSHTGGQSTSDGNGGTNALSLRGFGANRTLVLLDGVRITGNSVTGFYGTGGAVDTNAFPDGLISRVDVVTGGATAAYGSGALTGVVNMILDKNYTGIKGSVTGGITTYGDDPQYAVSLTGGTGFANGRGHFLISGTHTWTKGVRDSKSRDFVANVWNRITNPAFTETNGQPFYIYADHAGTMVYNSGGLINAGPLKGIAFGPGGVPRAFQYGTLNDGFTMSGGDWEDTAGALTGTWGPDTSLDIPVSRMNLFTRASYELTDNVSMYAQFMNSEVSTSSYSRYNYQMVNIQRDNVFLPADIVARMTAAGVTSVPVGTYMKQLGQLGGDVRRHFNMYMAGMEGTLPIGESDWHWNAYATRSSARTSARGRNTFNLIKFRAAADAVRGPNGAPVCRINVDAVTTNDDPACSPYNIIGTDTASQAGTNYILSDVATLIQFVWLDQVAATVNGEPFSTWAGPVSVAAGVEYHVNHADGYADPVALAVGYSSGNYNSTTGSYNTKEIYGETVVPLAKDMPWATSLDLNAGVRYTDFSTSGVVWTWKVGATYRPYEDLRFRTTLSRDTRSPNMGELYARGLFTNATITDIMAPGFPFVAPARPPTVPYQSVTQGNPSLAPEVGYVTGIGGVYAPSWLPGFTTSLDYFKIHIFISIAGQGGGATLQRCIEGQVNFCNNVLRDAAGNLIRIYARPTNSGGARRGGFDYEAAYRMPLSDLVESWDGDLTLRGLVTHVNLDNSTNPDGVVSQGTQAKWRYNVSASYSNDSFSVGWTGHGVGTKYLDNNDIECVTGCPVRDLANNVQTVNINHISPMFFMDLDFSYKTELSENFRTDFFLSIDNFTNKFPPGIIVNGPLSDIPSPLGRMFRGGVRFRM